MSIRQTSIDGAYLSAFVYSQQSKDESTKVGCVLTTKDFLALTAGYNSFPEGVETAWPDRHERPAKYAWTVHAELNALAGCARLGMGTAGLYCFCTQIPCSTCMGMLIQCQIAKIICPNPSYLSEKWLDDAVISVQMAKESGIDLFYRQPPPKESYETTSPVS